MKTFDFSQSFWQLIVIAAVCYLCGCFNFALIISRLKHRDITKMGSGNPGTMNMSREFGWKVGLTTFFFDALKAGFPCLVLHLIYKGYVFLGTEISVSDFMRYFGGLFVVIGHIYPFMLKGKGGKGIASTLGLFWVGLACENAWFALIVFTFLIGIILFIFVTEWGALGSLLGVTGLSIVQLVIFYLHYAKILVNAYLVCLFLIVFLINVLTWFAHRANLRRLFSGEEHRTSMKKIIKKKSE